MVFKYYNELTENVTDPSALKALHQSQQLTM